MATFSLVITKAKDVKQEYNAYLQDMNQMKGLVILGISQISHKKQKVPITGKKMRYWIVTMNTEITRTIFIHQDQKDLLTNPLQVQFLIDLLSILNLQSNSELGLTSFNKSLLLLERKLKNLSLLITVPSLLLRQFSNATTVSISQSILEPKIWISQSPRQRRTTISLMTKKTKIRIKISHRFMKKRRN